MPVSLGMPSLRKRPLLSFEEAGGLCLGDSADNGSWPKGSSESAVMEFYDRHALPMRELYSEKQLDSCVESATRCAG